MYYLSINLQLLLLSPGEYLQVKCPRRTPYFCHHIPQGDNGKDGQAWSIKAAYEPVYSHATQTRLFGGIARLPLNPRQTDRQTDRQRS